MVSFIGKVANPVADARLSKMMSQPALGKRLGLSRQYISRVEQGTYSSLNPALKRWTAEALSISEPAVFKRYRNFQSFVRAATKEDLGVTKLERRPNNVSPGHRIFEEWRSGYWSSPVQFSVDFCVHPDAVQKYEEGIQKVIPTQVFDALREVDLIDKNWSEDFANPENRAPGSRPQTRA